MEGLEGEEGRSAYPVQVEWRVYHVSDRIEVRHLYVAIIGDGALVRRPEAGGDVGHREGYIRKVVHGRVEAGAVGGSPRVVCRGC